MAVYFFVVIVLQRPKKAARLLPFFYIFNWGIPIGIVIWLFTKGSLGRFYTKHLFLVTSSFIVVVFFLLLFNMASFP